MKRIQLYQFGPLGDRESGSPFCVKVHYAMRYNGPSGATESDDMENWNYVYPASQGVTARQYNYNFSNGFGRGVEREGYPAGLVFNGARTEESHRARFSRWLAFMEADS